MNKQHKITNVDTVNKTGECSICGPVKVKINTGDYWRCMVAFNGLKYKVEPSVLNKLKKECAICKSNDRLVHDHDHKTGIFRGYLCHRCNITIGMVDDDIILLENMIKYLS